MDPNFIKFISLWGVACLMDRKAGAKRTNGVFNVYSIRMISTGVFFSQCAYQESNKVERYSKTNCTMWTGMPQGFQIYFVWNPRKSDMEGLYKLLPAKPAKLPDQACLALRSLYGPSMSYVLGFQTKYIWNPWGIPVHPAQLVLLYLSTLLDSWLAHCATELYYKENAMNIM